MSPETVKGHWLRKKITNVKVIIYISILSKRSKQHIILHPWTGTQRNEASDGYKHPHVSVSPHPSMSISAIFSGLCFGWFGHAGLKYANHCLMWNTPFSLQKLRTIGYLHQG
jgi:hypothetical protein